MMKDIKTLINEDVRFNKTFHKEQMEQLADDLKSAGYSDKIVNLFKNYSNQYITPGFVVKVLLELKK